MIFTLKGRKTIKPELHQDYQTLCSLSNPVAKWLFGDDLSKKVKDMTDVIKVDQHVSHMHQFDKVEMQCLSWQAARTKTLFRLAPIQSCQEKRELQTSTVASVNLSNLSLTSLPNLPNICPTEIDGWLKNNRAILDTTAHFHILDRRRRLAK